MQIEGTTFGTITSVAEKHKSDDAQMARLIARGTPVTPVKTGTDGGMNAAFLSKYKPTLVQGNDGEVQSVNPSGRRRTPSSLQNSDHGAHPNAEIACDPTEPRALSA
jgi:hypothetical protein